MRVGGFRDPARSGSGRGRGRGGDVLGEKGSEATFGTFSDTKDFYDARRCQSWCSEGAQAAFKDNEGMMECIDG